MVATTAKWAWTLEDDEGEFVASMAIMPDVNRRGWFVSYPGERIRSSAELRPLFRLYTIFRDSGAVYDELRAWVASDDERAVRFASWFGFEFDCGPATRLSPTGRDLSLWLWQGAKIAAPLGARPSRSF
ncbi:MAG TPA: hypothetical protein DEA05_08445 [Rhodobacteraceae bacterium]|nr:hypothetical protein [Paracoccaceae bacterium]